MSLIPELQIGWLNAWLGIIPAWLSGMIFLIANRKAGKRAIDISWYGQKEKIWAVISFSYYIVIILSLFAPLKLRTAWFYTGLAVFILAFIPLIIAYVNFASTPLDQTIVKGIYRISRNPIYFFTGLAFLGAGIASGSWLMIFLLLFYNFASHFIVLGEERYCEEKYGRFYIDYKNRTPRYFLFF